MKSSSYEARPGRNWGRTGGAKGRVMAEKTLALGGKRKSGTEAWVDHHYERGRIMAEEDFATLSPNIHTRWSFNGGQSDQMEKSSWLQTMRKLIGAREAK